MPSNKVQNFNAYRSKMNAKILDGDHKIIKRIIDLRYQCLQKRLSSCKNKRTFRFSCISSTSLRRLYCLPPRNLFQRRSDKRRNDGSDVYCATLVGGTIVIPHLRRAYEFWKALEETDQLDGEV